MNLPYLFEDALNMKAKGFLEVIDKAINLLKAERGQIGNLTVSNRLVELKAQGEALVIGDLHGDIESLSTIIERSDFLNRLQQNKDASIIFLGDYGDRGSRSAEVFYVALSLKLAFPRQVILLRGNHEGTKDLMVQPNDLPLQFQNSFQDEWLNVYEKIRSLFPHLYNGLYVKEKYLMVHGGISPRINSLQDIAQASEDKNEDLLADLLWSDPVEEAEVYPNPRGAGICFGTAVTAQFLGKIGVEVLIRGHEPCIEGYKTNHEGRVLTLFSRTGAPYYNRHGAYLQLPLAEKTEHTPQTLLRYIHKFP